MDLTFQDPIQYYSLKHWTLLSSPVTSTTGCCSRFGSASSFFLELFFHSSPEAYWAPTNQGSSSFSVLSFLLFHTVHGVLKVIILKWFAILFSSGTCFVRTLHHDPSVNSLPWRVALYGMAQSFIELEKAVIQVISLSQSVQFSHSVMSNSAIP